MVAHRRYRRLGLLQMVLAVIPDCRQADTKRLTRLGTSEQSQGSEY